MFNGIIQQTGKIIKINASNKIVWIKPDDIRFNDDIKLGDSIAVNGICLTVESKKQNLLQFSVSDETAKVTTYKFWKIKDTVNLEKAMALNAKIDGHLVYGHVNNIAKLIAKKHQNNTWFLTFRLKNNQQVLKLKDSIAINGISLTINDLQEDKFSVSIIPFTYQHTNLVSLKVYDYVNIETNLLTNNLASIDFENKPMNKNTSKKSVTYQLLVDTGFISRR